MKQILILLFVLTPNVLKSQTCELWFKKLKIEKNCAANCITAKVDIVTYMCPAQCESLCKEKDNTHIEDIGFYGLTQSEIEFCKKNKLTCATAYIESVNAEKYCLQLYPQSALNDESDACRHFVWAVLLEKSIGTDDAESILAAHENNPIELEDQKAMDLANNRLGQLSARKIKSNSPIEIINEFKKQLQANKLIILNRKY